MVTQRKFPEIGELVVGTVKEVKGFGAFVTLDEYPGKEGFIHIAEVASGWVKYVRDHVRENQKVVSKVVGLDKSKGHVDLSLKRVNDHQRREKIAEWKNEQKAEKLLEMFAESLGITVEQALEQFAYKLSEDYGSLYAAFEETAADETVLAADGFEGEWVPKFIALAQANISIPFVTITGFLEMQTFASDGIESIKKALRVAEECEYEDVGIEVQYVGAPRYRVKVRAPDYKSAEEEIRASADRAMKVITKSGGTASFKRVEEE